MVNADNFNLTFNHNYLTSERGGNCYLTIPFYYINATGPFGQKNYDDMILLGHQVLYSIAGFHWNYDTKKLAYVPYPGTNSDNNNITPSNIGGGFPGWLIAVLIVGGVLVIGAVAFICYREKKLKKDLEATNSYGSLA